MIRHFSVAFLILVASAWLTVVFVSFPYQRTQLRKSAGNSMESALC